MECAWVLRLKEESKDITMRGNYYFLDDDEADDWMTRDLQEATIYKDKEKEIEYMKKHERMMIEKFGAHAITNYGYADMMKKFEWVEVELE